jgi:hypothetical protein
MGGSNLEGDPVPPKLFLAPAKDGGAPPEDDDGRRRGGAVGVPSQQARWQAAHGGAGKAMAEIQISM